METMPASYQGRRQVDKRREKTRRDEVENGSHPPPETDIGSGIARAMGRARGWETVERLRSFVLMIDTHSRGMDRPETKYSLETPSTTNGMNINVIES